MIPKNNEIYKHFKGNLYKVITLAVHSETEEQMVVYQGLYGDFPIYCRPLSMFVSKVDHEKYPDVSQEYRFEKVDAIVSVDTSVNGGEDAELQQIFPTEKVNMEEMSVSGTEDVTLGNTQPETEDISEVDPLILEFLEAETILEKKNILTALHHRITDDMINTLAVVIDVVIEEGELENRYQQLKTCLETIDRYEIER